MKTPSLLSVSLLAAFGLLAQIASAQSTAMPASPAASPSAAAPAAAASSPASANEPAKASTATHHKKHKTSHAKTAAKQPAMADSRMATGNDTPYRMALKQCVQGPAANKDSCIDNAIARFGRG
jgi:hypothetical protein